MVTTIPEEQRAEGDAMRDALENYMTPQLLSVSPAYLGGVAPLVIVPKGMTAIDISADLDRYLPRPRRLKGTANVTALDSLIALVTRYCTINSALFANDDRKSPSITAVLNYNNGIGATGGTTPALPEFGDHRVHYAFPVSDEWKAWTAKDGVKMSMPEFAEFLEERIVDVLHYDGTGANDTLRSFLALTNATIASPQALLALSVGLKVQESNKVASAVRLQSGEGEINFASEHLDETGEKLKVPNTFLVGIPVFRGDHAYRLAARLRYRVAGGTVTFWFDLWRADLAFDDAFKGACAKATDETSLPLYYGKPE